MGLDVGEDRMGFKIYFKDYREIQDLLASFTMGDPIVCGSSTAFCLNIFKGHRFDFGVHARVCMGLVFHRSQLFRVSKNITF